MASYCMACSLTYKTTMVEKLCLKNNEIIFISDFRRETSLKPDQSVCRLPPWFVCNGQPIRLETYWMKQDSCYWDSAWKHIEQVSLLVFARPQWPQIHNFCVHYNTLKHFISVPVLPSFCHHAHQGTLGIKIVVANKKWDLWWTNWLNEILFSGSLCSWYFFIWNVICVLKIYS